MAYGFPYTFPFTFHPDNLGDYVIECDWNNDGDFSDTYDNISGDVKYARITRGKDEELGKAQVGVLELRVNNADGKYSPSNTGSVLSGSLLPKRPIRIREFGGKSDGTVAPLFYGYIEEIVPHPHLSLQDAYISALDGLDYLSRHELDTILYKDTVTGTLVGNILTAAGWSATLRTLDAGQDTVPYAYWSKVSARTALNDVEDSELGFVYIDGSGNLVYEDRHHRYSATHQTSQATFTNSMADIDYYYGARKIYNEIRATVTPWELQSIAELWRLQETPSIPDGETYTWWADASVSGESVFVDTWTDINDGATDYTANSQSDGLGDNETGNTTVTMTKFAQSAKIEILNSAGHLIYITLLKARGTYYNPLTKVTRKASDSTSQTAYQKRTLSLDGKYLTNAAMAQDYCGYALARFKDPQAEISITLINKNGTNFNQILSRQISDRITVVNTLLGLSKDYFINHIEHEITEGGFLHTCKWILVDASNEDFWCLDYSKLDTQTKVGY